MPNMSPKKNPMPSQDPHVRNKNYLEVATGYTVEMAQDEAARCLNCKHMPCVSGCPVNVKIPDFIAKIVEGDFEGAYQVISSTGSACNSDSLDPSHVLLSIGVPEEIGHGSMRFTFGPQNTMEEAKYLCDVLEEVIPRRRAMSCMWLQGQNTARQFSLKGEN